MVCGARINCLGLVGLLLGLAACGGSDPQSELDAAAQRLEQSLHNKQHKAVMQQLHEQVLAQEVYDRHAIQQRMLALFMRYKQINILVINRECTLDKGFYDRGHCNARVGVTGAQNVIPERADHYAVSSTWQLEGKEWKLLSLRWE